MFKKKLPTVYCKEGLYECQISLCKLEIKFQILPFWKWISLL